MNYYSLISRRGDMWAVTLYWNDQRCAEFTGSDMLEGIQWARRIAYRALAEKNRACANA